MIMHSRFWSLYISFGPWFSFRSDFGPIFDQKFSKLSRSPNSDMKSGSRKVSSWTWSKIDILIKPEFCSKFSGRKTGLKFPEFSENSMVFSKFWLTFQRLRIFKSLLFFSLSCFSDFFAKNLFHRFSKTEIIEKGH